MYGAHRELHVLTHSFPTRRSSDLLELIAEERHTSLSTLRTQLKSFMAKTDTSRQGELIVLLLRSITPLVGKHDVGVQIDYQRSEEHTSELQSLMRISYAVFCLKKKTIQTQRYTYINKGITT